MILLLLLLRFALVLFGPLEEQGAPRALREQRPAERLRERFRERPRAERERLEQHLSELESLPPAVRRKLLERARALRERERSLEEAMPLELRRRMDELGPELGRELWREHVREHVRERGKELRARLPELLRARLETAPPEVRRRFLERLVQERERYSRQALGKLRRERALSVSELEQLEALPLTQRLHALHELLGRTAQR